MSVTPKKTPSYPWQIKNLNKNTPFPRCDYSLASAKNGAEIWLFGGLGRSGPRNDLYVIIIDSLEAMPMETTPDASFGENGLVPPPRDGHTSVTTVSHLLLFGGECDDGKCEDSLYAMEIESKAWHRVPITGNAPVGRRDHAAVYVNDVMYIFGGQTDGYFLHDLIAFEVSTCKSMIYPANLNANSIFS